MSCLHLSSSLRKLLLIFTIAMAEFGMAQCTNYVIFMDDAPDAADISWSFVDQFGVTVLSGGAPFNATMCLPDGCYTLLMFDSAGDDWDGLDWNIEEVNGPFSDHTTLNNSSQDLEQFELGTGNCNPGGGDNCSGGQNPFYIDSDPGGSPGQMSWTLALNGVVISSGGSNTSDTLCMDPSCLVLVMSDTGNNGWQGGVIVITDENGTVVYSGTLASGSTQTVNIPVDGGNCSNPGGGGPGGGGPGGGVPGTGPGGGCSLLPPGGDCASAGCACDPFTFQITPSGFGNVDELPASGSVSNPSFTSGPPWGGTAPFGCLLAGELNSRWITFTVGSSGTLQFAFGAGGEQVGFYDWAMWPLNGATTCDAIKNDTQAPVRCVWNATTVGGTGLANPLPTGGDPGNYGPPLNVTAGQQFIICLSNWSFVNTSVTLDFFGTAGIQCGPAILPVELIAFNARPAGSDVLTEWTTASEHDNDRFLVERSATTEEWHVVGSIPSLGNSTSLQEYDFVDHTPLAGQSYYRLRQIDQDGTEAISSVVAVYMDNIDPLMLWPQPTNGRFHVSGLNGIPVVIDALGRQVEFDLDGTDRTGQLTISLRNATPGLYFLVEPSMSGRALRVLVEP